MNSLDEELIQRLCAELDALSADVSAAPPLGSSVGVVRVITARPRADRRRVLVLAAAMVALIAAVAALVAVRHDRGAVGSPDSSAGTSPIAPAVITVATAPVATHPIPPSPDGWDLVEWGNVRLSLPPDMSPFHTGNGCVATQGDINLEIACGDASVRISSAQASLDSSAATDVVTDRYVNGLKAALLPGECIDCHELALPELTSTVTVQRHDDAAANAILDTVGPSGTWRHGFESRPTSPSDWKTVQFEGQSIRVPSDWAIQTVAKGELSPCPQAVISKTVLLDSGVQSDCDDPTLVAPTDGVRFYVAKAPIPTHLGWAEQMVGSERPGVTFVVARVGYGVDPTIGVAILSSFADVSTDTSSTYATVPPVSVPYFAVGDSVMLGAKSNLEGRGINTEAAEAADTTLELEKLHEATSQFDITNGVVVQLGTNGTVTREQYESVLAEVPDVTRVVVMTVKADRAWIAGNNDIIRSLQATHANVVVLDWEARSAEVADHLASDGIHLGDDVAKVFYTNLILEALGLPT